MVPISLSGYAQTRKDRICSTSIGTTGTAASFRRGVMSTVVPAMLRTCAIVDAVLRVLVLKECVVPVAGVGLGMQQCVFVITVAQRLTSAKDRSSRIDTGQLCGGMRAAGRVVGFENFHDVPVRLLHASLRWESLGGGRRPRAKPRRGVWFRTDTPPAPRPSTGRSAVRQQGQRCPSTGRLACPLSPLSSSERASGGRNAPVAAGTAAQPPAGHSRSGLAQRPIIPTPAIAVCSHRRETPSAGRKPRRRGVSDKRWIRPGIG